MTLVRSLAVASLCSALAACDAGSGGKPAGSAGPTLSIAAPRMDQTFDTDQVELMLDLRNYSIGKVEQGGNGQHVHVILDNEPYEAVYDVSKGIPLGKPDADGKKRTLKEGTHVVRVFPSAGPPKNPGDAEHHESRKNAGAFAWVRFHVKKADGELRSFDGTTPTLTYSRPKGSYPAGTPERERLLLDFYVTGTKLSADGHRVRVMVDGKEPGLTDTAGKPVTGPLTEWKPYLISPTPGAGEHTVVLELIDKDGNLVTQVDRGGPQPLPFSKTERKITLP